MAYVRQPLFQRQPVVYEAVWLATCEPNHIACFLADAVAQLEAQRSETGAPIRAHRHAHGGSADNLIRQR